MKVIVEHDKEDSLSLEEIMKEAEYLKRIAELEDELEELEDRVDKLESADKSFKGDFLEFLKAFCLSHNGVVSVDDLYSELLKAERGMK